MRVRNVKFGGNLIENVFGCKVELGRETNNQTGIPSDYTWPGAVVLKRDATNRGQTEWFRWLTCEDGSTDFVDVEFEQINDQSRTVATWRLAKAFVEEWSLDTGDPGEPKVIEVVTLRCGDIKMDAGDETSHFELEQYEYKTSK